MADILCPKIIGEGKTIDPCKELLKELITVATAGPYSRNELFATYKKKAKDMFGDAYVNVEGLLAPLGHALVETIYRTQHIHDLDLDNLKNYLEECIPAQLDELREVDGGLAGQIQEIYNYIENIYNTINEIYEYVYACCEPEPSCYSALSGETGSLNGCVLDYGQIIELVDDCCGVVNSLDFGGLEIVVPDFRCPDQKQVYLYTEHASYIE